MKKLLLTLSLLICVTFSLSAQNKVKYVSSNTSSMNLTSLNDNNVNTVITRQFLAGYNTLCLPFSMSNEQLSSSAKDIRIERLAGVGQEGSTLCLYFIDCTNEGIEAGMPYLIYSPTTQTLRAQSKSSSTGDGYKQWELLGTSDGSLSWTGGDYSSSGEIEIVDSSSLPGSIGYIRYSSGLQICWGYVNCVNYGYKSKYSQFTFPVAFKDPTYQVTACPLSSNMDIVANIKSGRTTTYCNIGVRNLSQSSSNWTADVLIHVIGYWK